MGPRAIAVVLCSLALGAGCGNSSSGNHAGGGPDSGTAHADAAPDAEQFTPAGTKYTVSWGSVTVAPGVEDTQCVILRVGNPDAIRVNQIENHLSAPTHHVIVYRDEMDTTEQPTPFDCQPFTGALDPTGMVAPLMISQVKDDLLTLPDGVAFTLAPNQMVRIEMHYINATDSPVTASESTDIYAADPATINNEADLLFIGTPDITLPPNTMTTVHEFFTPGPSEAFLNANIFAITGHVHHLGTDVQVNTGTSPTDTAMVPVYNPPGFVWSDPPTVKHDPTFQIPTGGGFDFTCNYNNTTSPPVTVKFGESANDEMCFFWAYYYPSAGAHVCVHTDQYGGHDICCPAAAGDDISKLVCAELASAETN